MIKRFKENWWNYSPDYYRTLKPPFNSMEQWWDKLGSWYYSRDDY